ncbi:MAG: hypothetical protein Aurels2KO_55990 [Aureliella sp.]
MKEIYKANGAVGQKHVVLMAKHEASRNRGFRKRLQDLPTSDVGDLRMAGRKQSRFLVRTTGSTPQGVKAQADML